MKKEKIIFFEECYNKFIDSRIQRQDQITHETILFNWDKHGKIKGLGIEFNLKLMKIDNLFFF